MRKVVSILAPAILLAACGDTGGADADGDGTITQEEMMAEAQSGGDITMEPGEWENTITFTDIDMPGLPEEMRGMLETRMGSGITTKMCMTQEDVAEPDAEFFSGQGNDDCTYDEFDRSGNTITIRMTCTVDGGGTAKMAMDGEFSSDSYTMDIDSTVSGAPMGDMSMKGTVSAKRLGDCPS